MILHLLSAMVVLSAGGTAVPDGLCPQACVCSETELPSVFRDVVFVMNCSTRGLKQFPADTPITTHVLDLSHNALRNLSRLPTLPHLLVLNLSHNDIAFVDNHWVFEHLQQLTELDLSHNALTTLQHGSFSGLHSLETLRLSHNNIRTVQLHAFGGLNNLHTLHLSYNDLYQLCRPWLLAMTSLRELYLDNNHISVLQERTLDKHSSLLHLDISHNGLKRVADGGFVGLTGVKVLNASDNELEVIPTVELQRMVSLDILLMDSIGVTRLRRGDLSHLSVSSLSLSFLPRLQVVHQDAFSNLTRLRTLQLHDNPNLIFIHPRAFQGVPLLHRVFVHNNQLVTLSAAIRDSLPMLDELHVYHNPLHCDCNILWLKRDLLALNAPNHTDATHADYIQEARLLTCKTPALSTKMQILQVPLQLLPPVCAPTALPLFPDKINVSLGDDVTLECHAIGVPEPTLTWITPAGRHVSSITQSEDRKQFSSITDTGRYVNSTADSDNSTFPVGRESYTTPAGSGSHTSPADIDSHISPIGRDSHTSPFSSDSHTSDNTVLTLQGVQPKDQGTYVCQATNSIGTDSSSTVVYVQNKQLRLAVTDVANTYITVAWVGAVPLQQISDFQLYYRPSEGSRHYDKVYLHSSMHQCRLAGLTPMTSYEICIVYRDTFPVQCANFSTDHRVALLDSGITRVNIAGVVASACFIVGITLVACVARAVVRKLRRRKDYKDPLRGSADVDKIPLEPLHQPPGTPLCSSRTALLPHSQI